MPPWAWLLASTGGSIATGLISLIKYRMRLRFYLEVFARRGDRRDLEVAGKVMAPARTMLGLRWSRRRQPPLYLTSSVNAKPPPSAPSSHLPVNQSRSGDLVAELLADVPVAEPSQGLRKDS
jgi:hypothetical protein